MPALMQLDLGHFAAFLNQRAEQLARVDFRQPLRVILQRAKASVKENFAGGHAPDGTPWLPLKRPRQGKRHKNSSPLPLRDRGILMASVTAQGAEHVEKVTDVTLEVGTNLPYAGIQQDGGTVHVPARQRNKPWVFQSPQGGTIFTRKIKAHDVTIPARPFLGWNDRLIDQAAEVLAEALERSLLA